MKRRLPRGAIARGTLRTSLVLGLRLAVQAGTLLLVARLLGPDQFGAFAGVAALAVILGTLATFGTSIVLLGEVSKDPLRREQVLPYAVPTTLLCGGALLGIYLPVCLFALHATNIPLVVLVAIGVTEMLLQPLLVLASVEHLGLGRIARSQLLLVLPLALRLTSVIAVFALTPADPLAAYGYGYFIAAVAALTVAIATLPTPWPAMKRWRAPRRQELRQAIGYAAMNITSTGPAELDKTLAASLLPLGAAGLYAAGARVIGAATLPVVAMMVAALPRLFREGQEPRGRATHLLRWIFAAALGYSVVLSAMLWIIAPLFVWVFGARYQGIDHTIHWLALTVPGLALRIAAGEILMTLGRPWMRVFFETFGLAVLMIAAIVMTRHFGNAGMPLALACSEWGMAGVGMACIAGARRALSAVDH